MRRASSLFLPFVLVLPLSLVLACHPKEEGKDDTGPGDTVDTGEDLPVICNAGTSWTDGSTAFVDATASWGLDVLAATGTRVIAVDFDGDGWTDLAVRSASEGADDFAAGTRTHWLLRNTGAGGFEDVTQASGVVLPRVGGDPNEGRPGQVWAFGDVDNDGDLDVFTGLSDTSDSQVETSEIMLNQGDGTFVLGPVVSDHRRTGEESTAGATFVDYDRDGILDLWTPQYYYAQDRLYQGDGAGAFREVTNDVGLRTKGWTSMTSYDELNEGLAHSVAWSALACDLNGDGDLELMAASYGRAPNHLWQAKGDGTFENRSVPSGYAYDEGMDWTTNESARCYCHLYPETDICKGVPEPAFTCNDDSDNLRGWDPAYDTEAWRLGGNSGTTVCGDLDNDGWMDLLTTEIYHWDVGSSSDVSEILHNQGFPTVTFTRPGNDVTGLVRDHSSSRYDEGDMSAAIFDFDLDGWLDPFIGSSDYPGTRALLWHNNGDGSVSLVPTAAGLDHRRSHGVAVADFDRDGDLDIVLGHSSARCGGDCYDTFNVRFFENVTGVDQGVQPNFLQLQLVGGAGTNRAAIGARVKVTANGVTQTQEVGGGYGHYGIQHDLLLTFGLGPACEAEVTVRWPDAALTRESFTLGGGYRYRLEQGERPAAVIH